MTYLEHDLSDDLWIRLLRGDEFTDDLIHHILGREEVGQEGGQYS